MTEILELQQPSTVDQSLDFLLRPPETGQLESGEYAALMTRHRGVVAVAASMAGLDGNSEARAAIQSRIARHVEASLVPDGETSEDTIVAGNALADPVLGPFAADAIMQAPNDSGTEPDKRLERIWAIVRQAKTADPDLKLPEPFIDHVMFMSATDTAPIADSPLINHTTPNLMELSSATVAADDIPAVERLDGDGALETTTEQGEKLLAQAVGALHEHARQLFTMLAMERDIYYGKVAEAAASTDGLLGDRYWVTHRLLHRIVGQPDQIALALRHEHIIMSNDGVQAAIRQLETELLLAAQGSIEDLRSAAITMEDLGKSSELGRQSIQAQTEIELLEAFRGDPEGLRYAMDMGEFRSARSLRAAWIQHDHDLIASTGTDRGRLRGLIDRADQLFFDIDMVREARARHDDLLLAEHRGTPDLLSADLADDRFYTEPAREAARQDVIRSLALMHIIEAN